MTSSTATTMSARIRRYATKLSAESTRPYRGLSELVYLLHDRTRHRHQLTTSAWQAQDQPLHRP